MRRSTFHHEIPNFRSPFSLPLCYWGHITPGASWVPVALPSLLPEQITEAVLPWEQSGPPRAVTGQLHRKDSAPEQWNWAVRIWSPPFTECGPLGLEMATPQPSWWQTTLALARLQWEAQSALHCPELFISTCASHWEEPFVMSLLSMLVEEDRVSAKSHDFLTWTGCSQMWKAWPASHLNRQPEQLHCGDKCPLNRALWGRLRAQAPPPHTWTLQPRPRHWTLWRAHVPGQTQPCHTPALHRWPRQWEVWSSHQILGSRLLQNTLLLALSRVHPLQPDAQIRGNNKTCECWWYWLETTHYRPWCESFSF